MWASFKPETRAVCSKAHAGFSNADFEQQNLFKKALFIQNILLKRTFQVFDAQKIRTPQQNVHRLCLAFYLA
jgi:hypothetical protein